MLSPQHFTAPLPESAQLEASPTAIAIGSQVHVALQPSPARTLPSSHSSRPSIFLSPQAGAWQTPSLQAPAHSLPSSAVTRSGPQVRGLSSRHTTCADCMPAHSATGLAHSPLLESHSSSPGHVLPACHFVPLQASRSAEAVAWHATRPTSEHAPNSRGVCSDAPAAPAFSPASAPQHLHRQPRYRLRQLRPRQPPPSPVFALPRLARRCTGHCARARILA